MAAPTPPATGAPTKVQWINRLEAKIETQERYAEPFERRYRNEHVLPFLAKEYAEVYPGLVVASADGRVTDSVLSGSLLSMLDVPKTGTAGIVIDALTERLMLGGIEVPDDKAATKKLQQAWDENDLDVMHTEGTREALIGSRAFVSTAREVNGSRAVVGIESCTQAAAAREQRAPYNVIAYLKVWRDEWTGKRAGLLRLPGDDWPLWESETEERDPDGSNETTRWRIGEAVPTHSAEVQVVELAPRSRLLSDPVSEIAPIASLVDIVDLVEGLLVFAGHFGAVPIRYATNIHIPRDPKDPTKPLLGPDGKPQVGFNPRADHMWFGNQAMDSQGKATGAPPTFGQLEPASLASFVTWAEHASSRVRAKTALASTYFSLDLKSHMSAELLKTDEAPMVRRVRRMGEHGSLNSAWRRHGKHVLDIEDPGKRHRVAPRWIDPETRIESQLVDQFQKLIASGMGVRTVAEKVLKWDPETIAAAVDEYEARQDALVGGDAFSLLDPATRANLKVLNGADPKPPASA